ncbi:hypothetical protein RND71_042286 [Anisodus tanguticus]|uniref:Pectin acetylesterase n=1 Tax=Anisodus tanguticus TaxID=243964 RepID=A0AAE1QPY8_9SOLA|nr:hypothetical protein RND71_042286 [Anisodus tanguticus]
MAKLFMGFLVLSKWVETYEFEDHFFKKSETSAGAITLTPLMIGLTLIQGAAVCLDGTLPGYHIHPGSGSGANSWLIQLEVY